MAALSYLLLCWGQSVSSLFLLRQVSYRSSPIWQHLWNVRGSMVSAVTTVSNLPNLSTLLFPSSVRGTKATRIPGWINKLSALSAIQKHSSSVAFEDISCACPGWWGKLWCQSLPFGEHTTVNQGLSLPEVTWAVLKCTVLPIPALNLYSFISCSS